MFKQSEENPLFGSQLIVDGLWERISYWPMRVWMIRPLSYTIIHKHYIYTPLRMIQSKGFTS